MRCAQLLTCLYSLFLVSWSLSENQSEERYATQYSSPSRVQSSNEARSRTHSCCQVYFTILFKPLIFRGETVRRDNTALHCSGQKRVVPLSSDEWSLRLKAAPIPLLWLAVVIYQWGSSFIRKGIRCDVTVQTALYVFDCLYIAEEPG
jgi:hypothetical protein